VHKTDLIHFLTDQRVIRTTARLATLDKRGADGELIGVDDNAVCIYEMSGGIMGTMTASWTFYGAEDNSTILYGEKGIMRIYDDPAHSIVVKLADGSKIMYDVEAIQTNDNQTKSGIIDLWMKCLTTNTPPEISGESALYAMRAIFASIRSSEIGQTVEIPENRL
jgi:predicted dehydrogenase